MEEEKKRLTDEDTEKVTGGIIKDFPVEGNATPNPHGQIEPPTEDPTQNSF